MKHFFQPQTNCFALDERVFSRTMADQRTFISEKIEIKLKTTVRLQETD